MKGFGIGLRDCLGEFYLLLQKIVVTTILKKRLLVVKRWKELMTSGEEIGMR